MATHYYVDDMSMRRALVSFGVVVLLLSACSDSKGAAPGAGSSASASSSAPRTLRILVSNDDGVNAPGIDALVQALIAEPDVTVTVVAPADNQSGSGAKTTPGTLTATNAATASDYPAIAVQGFPADAVIYALMSVMKERPDVVITGTNAGQNIGPLIDVSGTVGAARAAAQRGIPALAVSAGLGDPIDFADATADAVQWVRDHRDQLVANPAPAAFVDNLNAPTCKTGKVRALVLVSVDRTAAGGDPLGTPDCTSTASPAQQDVASFLAGFATLSPVPIQPGS
jgi:5'-nucleotidase